MRRMKRPSKKEFQKKYYKSKINIKEMAKEYKVKPQTIYNWANYYKKNK